jgi:hypothetical protein
MYIIKKMIMLVLVILILAPTTLLYAPPPEQPPPPHKWGPEWDCFPWEKWPCPKPALPEATEELTPEQFYEFLMISLAVLGIYTIWEWYL